MAGTVALMTTWADPCPEARIDPATQRSLLARKVVSNLFFLQNHPQISDSPRRVMAKAHGRWVEIARRGQATGASTPVTGTVEASVQNQRLH